MLTKSQKNHFFIFLMASNMAYPVLQPSDFLDMAYPVLQPSDILDQPKIQNITSILSQEDVNSQEIATVQKVEKPAMAIDLEKNELSNFINNSLQKSKKSLQGACDLSGTANGIGSDDSFEFKINKIGLATGALASLSVLTFNHITRFSNIRNNSTFKVLLGVSSGYLVYKLVATNEIVKKDISDVLSKIKKS